MRLKLFGTPALLRAGQPLEGPAAQRRRLALLALLARSGPGGIARDRLLALLWPDTPEERARPALAQALYAIRRELGDDRVVAGSTELRLDPRHLPSDVADFEQALADGDDDAADRAWTGPFLDGFTLPGVAPFARWADDERDRLTVDWAALVERLARRAERTGDAAEAARQWRRLAGHDPLSGRIAQALVRALAAAGEREAALRHVRIHEALVRGELDVELDASWAALEAEVRAMVVAGPAVAPAPPVVAPADASPVRPLDAAPAERPAPAAVAATAGPPREPPAAAIGALAPAADAAPPAVGPTDAPVATTGPAPITPPDAPPPAAESAARARAADAARPSRSRLVIGGLVAAVAIGIAVLTWRWRGEGATAATSATLPTGSAAVEAPVLAVGTISAAAPDAALAAPLPDLIAGGLALLDGVRVVGRERLREVARAAGDSAPGAAAARAAGATELLTGAVARTPDGRWRLDLQRVVLADGTVRGALRLEGRDVVALADSAVEAIARTIARPGLDARLAAAGTRSARAWRYYEEAGRLVRTNVGETAARRLYEAALAEDPTFARAALALARLDEGMQQGPATRRALALAATAPPLVGLLVRAEHALATEDVAAAPLGDSLAARFPDDPEALLVLARTRWHAGDFAGAAAAYDRVWALDSARMRDRERPTCPACDASSGAVNALLAADSMDAAVAHARRWVAADPGYWQPWSVLADVLVYAGRWAEARAATDSMAARGGPQETHFRLFAAQQAGDSAGFERAVAEARRAGVGEGELRWRTILMRRDQGRLDEALALALRHRAAAARPARGLANEVAGEALVRLARGEGARAAALFDSIALNLPDDAPAGRRARQFAWYRTLGAEARAAAGDTAGLAALADTLAVVGQRSAYARDRRLHHHVRGLLLAARGDTAGAIGRFRAAMFSPVLGYTRSNLHLARLHLATGRRDEAARVLEQALRALSIGGPGIYASRGELRALLARARGGR